MCGVPVGRRQRSMEEPQQAAAALRWDSKAADVGRPGGLGQRHTACRVLTEQCCNALQVEAMLGIKRKGSKSMPPPPPKAAPQ